MAAKRETGGRRNVLTPGVVDITPPELLGGAALLDAVESYVRRFAILPTPEAYVAVVLWILHSHMIESFETSPRLLVCSPEPGSGKTRVLEIASVLSPRALHAVNVTPSYLFRKVEDENGRPTILFDEIDTVFGPKAKDNEEIRGFLNAGHRRGATAGRCVTRGKLIETEEIEAYCAVALAGLGFVPDTILSRSVVIRMRRRAPGEVVEPFRMRVHGPAGEALCGDLALWAEIVGEACGAAFPVMPDEVQDRDADVWEPLIAVADAAGGEWPARARVAAVALVADAKRKPPSFGVRLLADIRKVFGDRDAVPTEELLRELCAMDEAPWADMRGKALDARKLSRMLGDYDIKSTTVRIGSTTPKGYRRVDLHEAWQRYLPAMPEEAATSATGATEGAVPGKEWGGDFDPFG